MGGDLTQVLRRPVELAGLSGHYADTVETPAFTPERI